MLVRLMLVRLMLIRRQCAKLLQHALPVLSHAPALGLVFKLFVMDAH